MVLASAGQPLFAEDSWWHLAMGEAYVAEGPWLEADPALHTASGPPAPAAWLSDVTLYGVERIWGFGGLRVAHVFLVVGILGLAWSALRRASGSRVYASLGTGLFAVLSAYRLFQLRPHLFSIAAALLLVRLLIEDGEPPSRRRIAAAAGLLALWANLHGAFVLGPALLAAAVAGLVIASLLRPERWARDRPRAGRLAAALVLCLVATLANPAGLEPHLLYFAAGGATPALGVVADEWAPLGLFQLPVPNLPPSPLAWAVVWGLLLVTPCAVFFGARRRPRASTASATAGVDPALVGVAAAALFALLAAVRLLWLGIFPLLVVGQSARALGRLPGRSRQVFAWTAGIAAVLLVPGFARLGDWPMISQGVRRASYARPYPAFKHYAHAVWFLRDAGLEGNLFNDYASGNFLGYWLAPRMRVFVNGSLNVPQDVLMARHAIIRRAWEADEAFVELLERYRVDVFFGTGEPVVSKPNRPAIHTTTHLERTPGWIPVFRNLRSAVYLRADARNRRNLERVAAHYAREHVPFDPDRGFETHRVLREAPRWAVEHGLLPAHFGGLEAAARSLDPNRRPWAQAQRAAIYAALGLYERAEAIDRRLLKTDPHSVSAARRLVWSLLHQRRVAASLEAAELLLAVAPPGDGLSRLLADAAQQHAALPEAEAAALVATLPVFTRPEGRQLLAGFREPEARPRGR
jgi:hypothetical protein